jgi:hypothetical protein
VKECIISIILALSVTGPVHGQTEQMVVPGDLKQQTVITEPVTLRKGYFRTELIFTFSMEDRSFNDQGTRIYILGLDTWLKRSSYELDLRYGITDRLEARGRIPFVNRQTYQSILNYNAVTRSDSLFTNRNRGRGIGDIFIELHYQVLQENEKRPSLTLEAIATFPSGRKDPVNVINDMEYDPPVGTGCWSIESLLQARKILYPYLAVLKLSYEHFFPGNKIFDPAEPEIEFKFGDIIYLACEFGLHLNDWIALTNEFTFFSSGKNTYYRDPVEISDPAWKLDYTPSLYFQIRRFRFRQRVVVPLTGKNYSSDPTYVTGLSYTF